ncbi:aldehyde dehydrogenase family protein, partial [Microvirga sp. 3-52]|nr:aldehyde dehydrogenase family protein [Microvirga sp. 3-52]
MTKTRETIIEKEPIKRDYYKLFINGEQVDSVNGERTKIYNPATGKVIAEVAKSSQEDAEKAVKAARNAFD